MAEPLDPAAPRPRAPLGCLLLFSTPFLIFGLIMLGMTIRLFTSGALVGALWAAIGTFFGLGFAVGIIRGRNIDPSTVSRYPPAAISYGIGGLLVLLGLTLLRSAIASHLGGAGADAQILTFLAVAVLLLGAGVIVRGRARSEREAPLVAALQRKDPEPWRFVPEWADGKVRESKVAIVSPEITAAAIGNLVLWPIAIGWTLSPERPFGMLGLLIWILPVAAVVMTVRAVRGARHKRREGGAMLSMDPFPAPVGGWVKGTLVSRTALTTTQGVTFTATLTSMHHRVEVNDRGSGSRLSLLWEEKQTVTPEMHEHKGVRYVGVPISFAIPLSAQPTTLNDPSSRFFWKLVVTSDLPSDHFRTEMELPVFDLRSDAERTQEVPDLVTFPPSSPTRSAVHGPDAQGSVHAATRATVGSMDFSADRSLEGASASTPPVADAGFFRRLFPVRPVYFDIDEEHGGRITVTSESGDSTRAKVGVMVVAASVVAVMLILNTPVLSSINGIGLLPIWIAIGGGWMGFTYRPRKALVVFSTLDVTLRSPTVEGGEVMLQYSEIERATVETGVERTTPPPSGTIIRAIPGFDVQITMKDGRSWLAGLRAGDRQQAQWVAGTLNRRVTGPAAADTAG